jgi:hypothetical protein
MNRKGLSCLLSALALLLGAATAAAQAGAANCKVELTEPETGQVIPGEMIITGTAVLPPGHHLWAFVRPVLNFRTLGKWWPQGEGGVEDSNGRWELPATFGSPQKNIGHKFDVTAAVFDPAQHFKLKAYLENAMETGNWLPIEMPAAACAAQTVTVTKGRN